MSWGSILSTEKKESKKDRRKRKNVTQKTYI
jgi:hypothetical protein